MKKETKWTPHIIAVTALVVFIVLGLACASTPKPPTGLSQPEMRLNDPRMPPDRFYQSRSGNDVYLAWYWLGSQASGVSADQVSSLWVSSHVRDFRIDGRVIPRPNDYNNFYINLPPGRHTLTFSYWEYREITDNSGNKYKLTISFPSNQREIVMEPGKHYVICAVVDYLTRANVVGSRTASTTLNISEWKGEIRNSGLSYRDAISSTPPASLGSFYKYLEPYDSSLPLEKQAFLETESGIYIVGFNGDDVSWCWNNGHLIIGIPEGRHILQLVRDNIHYTMTLDCLAGSRYVLRFDSNNYSEGYITARNITGSASTNITRATENLGVLALYDIPAQYNGKYAFFQGKIPRKGDLNGYRSRTQQEISLVQIRDGKVNLPLRITNRSETQGYYGNDTASGHLCIYNTPTVTTSTIENIIAAVSFSSIRFSNGNASKSVNDGTLLTE